MHLQFWKFYMADMYIGIWSKYILGPYIKYYRKSVHNEKWAENKS